MAGNLYDQVRYPSRSYAQTHPDRLATMATLMGLQPAPVERCRVLEVGCGDGANLLAMAYALPGSEFLGIDLSEAAVAQGQIGIEALRLTNFTLRQADIGQVSAAEIGRFDYIIAHGVFSWVPVPVREQIFALCQSALAPQGVAYLSYNAYPGCHIREMSRRMMRFHVEQFEEPREKNAQGRALLSLLVNAPAEKEERDGYFHCLEEELEHATSYHESAFFHDDLSETNFAFYFHEFMALASPHGLQFLAEAELREMHATGYNPQVSAMLQAMAEQDPVAREQYLDFLKGRRFRQTLLCREALTVDRFPDQTKLASLLIAGELTSVPLESDAPPDSKCFQGPKGSRITTDKLLIHDALSHLGHIWPKAISLDELLKAIEQSDPTGLLGSVLLDAAKGGLIELRSQRGIFAANPGIKPTASAVARWQVQNGQTVTTLRHQRIQLDDDLSQQLLLLMDGTRDRTALLDDLSEAVRLGRAKLQKNGRAISEAGEIRAFLDESLDQVLQNFCRLALVVA